MNTILVTGISEPAGRNLSMMLSERHYRVIGTDSQFVSIKGIAHYQVPDVRDPMLMATYLGIVHKEKVNLIIPTVEELSVFSNGWQWIDQYPILSPSWKAVEIANDKYLTAQVLLEKKVSIPHFILPSQVNSPEQVAQKIGWPCIGKLRVGDVKNSIQKYSVDDWPLVATLSDAYFLQEFIPGLDLLPTLFMGKNKETVVIVLEKSEFNENNDENFKPIKRIVAPDIANLATKTAQAIGICGPIAMKIRRRSNGTPVVLDVNAHFWANIRFAPEVLDAALKAAFPSY